MTYFIHLQIFSCVLCFVLYRGNSGVTVRPLQTGDATLLLAKTSLNIFKQMSDRVLICLWSRKQLKRWHLYWNFFLTGLCVFTYIFCSVRYSAGILISVLHRICLTLVVPNHWIFTSFLMKYIQPYLLNLKLHFCHVSALFK